jgi:hypothetical protein
MFIAGFVFGIVVGFTSACVLYVVLKPYPDDFHEWKIRYAKPWDNDPYYTVLAVETPKDIRFFRGSEAVWHDLVSGNRCPVREEMILAEIYKVSIKDGRLNV